MRFPLVRRSQHEIKVAMLRDMIEAQAERIAELMTDIRLLKQENLRLMKKVEALSGQP